jgi:chromosome partitioning protein
MDAESYDVMLVDSPPFLGALALNALTAVELLIVPTQCEYYSVRSLRRTLQLVKLVREKTNPALSYCVLITMFDRRNRISHIVRDQLELWLTRGLLETVIEVDTKLRESAAAGRPITVYAPGTRGAVQYRMLAEELMNRE